MFSSHQQLKRKTPAKGICRREYIEHLVEEYHTTTNVEAQEQVSANLANFAYDPINWQYLKDAEALELFIELLQTQNHTLQLHGIAGLCNICLDVAAAKYINQAKHLKITTTLLLQTKDKEIFINCLTLYYQLLNSAEADLKKSLTTPAILKCINNWRQQTTDQRILNLCNIYLEDYGSRSEFVELTTTLNTTKNVTTMPAPSLLTGALQRERSATD